MESSSSDDSSSQDSFVAPAIGIPPSPSSEVQDHGEGDLSAAGGTDASIPTLPTPQEEVLSNRDILTLVFDSLSPPAVGPPDKATRAFLRDLALLCRSFSEPALDCLWKEMDSLVPLIRLLDSAVVVDGAYYLSGPPSGLSDTFKKHAMRVRSLHIAGDSSNAQDRVDPSVYVFFTQFLDGTPLLPGLNAFRFGSVNDPTFSWHTLPILFPCASLSEVILQGSVFESALLHRITLPLLVARAPDLRSLTIDDPNCVTLSSYEAFFTQGIFRFQHLRSLSCTTSSSWSSVPEVPRAFLGSLGSKLPHLERLKLDLKLHLLVRRKKRNKEAHSSNTSMVSEQSSAGTAVATAWGPSTVPSCDGPRVDQENFPHLRYLELSHRSETHFMRCYNMTSLIHNVVSLTLTLRPSWTTSLSEIVDGLARCPLLRSLTLKEDGDITFSADDILLLLAHLNLDQLHLEITHLTHWRTVVEHSDEPVASISETAEDSLERILTAASGLQEDPEPLRSLTLPKTWDHGEAGLVLFLDVAKKAPYMECLGISLDSSLTTSKLADLASLAPDIRRPSALKFLQIRDPRSRSQPFTTAEYKAISRYLDACFPDLMSLTLHPSSNSCVVDDWAHVEHLRVMYQENRRLAYALGQARAP